MGFGLLGILFFLKYNGTAIPLKELWFVVSLSILVIGAYFFAKFQLQKPNNFGEGGRVAEIERLKRTGDKVRVTLDNAEIKSRSYHQEIINDGIPSRMEMLDALYDENRNYRTEKVQQTYIVFYKYYGDTNYKFVSQATNRSTETIKGVIERLNGIDLYIDPSNPTNFYFDTPYL